MYYRKDEEKALAARLEYTIGLGFQYLGVMEDGCG